MGRVVYGASCQGASCLLASSMGQVVHVACCPWGVLSMASCPFGKLFLVRVVHGTTRYGVVVIERNAMGRLAMGRVDVGRIVRESEKLIR
jgi:hypothetical protein